MNRGVAQQEQEAAGTTKLHTQWAQLVCWQYLRHYQTAVSDAHICSYTLHSDARLRVH